MGLYHRRDCWLSHKHEFGEVSQLRPDSWETRTYRINIQLVNVKLNRPLPTLTGTLL